MFSLWSGFRNSNFENISPQRLWDVKRDGRVGKREKFKHFSVVSALVRLRKVSRSRKFSSQPDILFNNLWKGPKNEKEKSSKESSSES
jgi:hypothetical protein